ncbi:MAG: Do family serine endopeptidase [Chromatiales bacterium]|nr:Do family serine endopeptidase [Chromatiales bacterium]
MSKAFFIKKIYTLFLSITVSVFGATLVYASTSAAAMPSLAPMLEKAMPAVVNIATEEVIEIYRRPHPFSNDPFFRRFFDFPEFEQGRKEERRRSGVGSGVIIDADQGYIITNAHVVKAADNIYVTLDNDNRYTAKIVGIDEEADIAVIAIDAQDLVEIPIGDSEAIRVGDFAVAIGNPFQLEHTVTLGIISALGRSGLGIESYEDFIQTDASINPGNSGGALVDLEGRLIGINTAILGANRNIGIGFAIPVNMAMNITEQLIEHGEVKRGRLGVIVQTLTQDLADAFGLEQKKGVVITEVQPGSAAEKAGIEPGDIILSVNGKAIENSADIRNYIGLLRLGSKVVLEVLRDDDELEIAAYITARKMTATNGDRFDSRLSGAVLSESDNPEKPGVEINEVRSGSIANRYGLQKGDLIVAVNRRTIKDFDDFRSLIDKDKPLLLKILRGNNAMFLVLR